MRDVEELNLNMEGNLVREKWKNSGFSEDFNRVMNNNEPSQELVNNLIHLGAASAIQKAYKEAEQQCESDLEPFNVRAIGVFAHLLDQYGEEVYSNWTDNPGYERDYAIGDVDLYFPADRVSEAEPRPSIDRIYKGRIGTTIEESQNGDNLEGEKYTALLDFADNVEVEIDMIRPSVENKSDYPMAQLEPHNIETVGGANFAVPPLEECILHKGTLENDNGSGHDTVRDKDYKELVSLFAIAEDRGLDPEYFENEFEDEHLRDISSRVDGMTNIPEEWSYQPSDDYLARVDQWQHIYNE